MRVGLFDPGSILVHYEHALGRELARRGLRVDVLTSRFKFGQAPQPDGYERHQLFYPLSARLFRRSRAQLPLKTLEYPVGMVRALQLPVDVLHVQWSPVPELDRWVLPRRPSVITAHDVLPARTAGKRGMWRRYYRAFDRVVVHSEHGRRRLIEELGVDPERIAVIAHPVFFRAPRYEGAGGSLLTFGVIRPYKQVEHAVLAARVAGARLTVIGDPTYDLGETGRSRDVDWQLGYASDEAIDEALARADVTVFAYRQELDQSGALLRALGAGVPAVVYDVGSLGEIVRTYGAGAVVPPDHCDALGRALADLLGDPAALERARAGARRAAAELTWAAAAEQHEEIYRQVLGR